ncbi:MAG: glycosyltransferase [Smithellaceae bacterium]
MRRKVSTNRKVLFYAAVRDASLFQTMGFYETDIRILQDCGFDVTPTNRILDFLKFRTYDYAFIYFWTKGLLPAFIGKCFGKRVLFTGGIDSLDRVFNKSLFDYTLKKWLFRACMLVADAGIAVSRSDLQNIKKTGCRMNNIHLIPHAIDTELYAYDNRQKKNTILTVAWMGSTSNVKRKGVDRLLDVFQAFAATDGEFSLVLAGPEGEGSAYLKRKADRLHIGHRVVFTGAVSEEEKIRLLNESKYYFQLSEYEGFGIAAIEALAAGNLVFHSGRGGLADSMPPEGILVEDIDNSGAIAEALRQVDLRYADYQDRIRQGVMRMRKDYAYLLRRGKISNLLTQLDG